jgi:glutamate dehydrogenase
MKMIIDAQGNRESLQSLDAKLDEVLARLDAEESAVREQKLALAEILRQYTPYSFFIVPSVAMLLDWNERFLAFITQRSAAIQVDFIAQPDGRGFLLCLTEDAPFLLHSLQLCFGRNEVDFQVVCHPILQVVRDQDGVLQGLGTERSLGSAEAFIVFEIAGMGSLSPEQLVAAVRETVVSVQGVFWDQEELASRVREVATHCSPSEQAFWDWLLDENFLLFSFRQIQLGGEGGSISWAKEDPGSALGLEWEVVDLVPGEKRPLAELNEKFRGRMLRPTRIVVEEIDRRSPIYKDQRLTYIGLRDETDGCQIEYAFLGLFTTKAIEDPTLKISYLNERIEVALNGLSIPRGCHDYRKTIEIFNSFPKVELFFMADSEILEIVRSFTHLYRHGAVKVVPAHSLAVRGLTLLVILPGEFYSTTSLTRMESFLTRFFKADLVSTRIIHMSRTYLSLHVTIQTDAFDLSFDPDRLEHGLTAISRPWVQTLKKLLERRVENRKGKELWSRFGIHLPEEYQHLIHPRFAVRDLVNLTTLTETGHDGFDLWGPFGGDEPFFRLQYYSLAPSYLNDLLPCLDNFHLKVIDEVDFVLPTEGQAIYIKSFAVRSGPGGLSLGTIREPLLEALTIMRQGQLENDSLNKLMVLTRLDWQQVDLFRAYRNYYFQLGSPYTKLRVANALINNPALAELLYCYFAGRFNPDSGYADLLEREEKALMPVRLELIEALAKVTDVNEDNILRILFNLIDSTVRTNFFLRRDQADYFVSFKISAIGIIDMPAPRPLFETYVHSPTMEGIHLRGGMVARGGIRWSDRPDDFRTEVLGLMKTQMTKNALIVPVGSKGGFIVKTPFTTREAGGELSKAAYQTLMRGLLDLVDNRVGNQIVKPKRVVAHDDDDPYLVVAADKGTAHLPDTANGVSADYGFWLKDGFASGGSQGYDHKKLGITAKGAWECVQRHFRELGVDVQSDPVTVVGIGDMSGDVFGNGILLSRAIKLVAAFDHRHIFLDPNPDPEASWQERQRLFNLPRSSWDDYGRTLISKGGGVFSRELKEIPLSPEVQGWLKLRHSSIDPQGLISLLLASEVDLLWNGGIGTYVKASSEKHQDAGDRANDGLRIDALQLRARVIGEGGNLGMTQRARIEYALAGGRINTDAIDNSAGVDCSDHEVNLKIFLHYLMEQGKVKDLAERNRLLEQMTDEVSRAVLRNNYTQSLCLSLDQLRCQRELGQFSDLMARLSDVGLLDRGGEVLPGNKELQARPGKVLARPELSILLAYSKMQLYQALLEDELDLTATADHYLREYFPERIQEQFTEDIGQHPLGREIAATMITNHLVDSAGAAFCDRVSRATGRGLPQVALAYLVLDQMLAASRLRQGICQLDNRLPTERQHELLLAVEDRLAEMVQWGLNNGFDLTLNQDRVVALQRDLDDFRSGVTSVADADAADLLAAGMPETLIMKLAGLAQLRDFLPVVALARQRQLAVATVTANYLEIKQYLQIDSLLSGIEQVVVHDQWDRQAAGTLASQFEAITFDLTGLIFDRAGNAEPAVVGYFQQRRQLVKAYRGLQQKLAQEKPTDLHPFVVLLGSLRRLAV